MHRCGDELDDDFGDATHPVVMATGLYARRVPFDLSGSKRSSARNRTVRCGKTCHFVLAYSCR
jgi:hypothetical protein